MRALKGEVDGEGKHVSSTRGIGIGGNGPVGGSPLGPERHNLLILPFRRDAEYIRREMDVEHDDYGSLSTEK